MTNMESYEDRRAQARIVARDLVELLENDTASVATCLMKAQRLARLLRDSDAQRWLDLEMRGYPAKMDLARELGSCAKYSIRSYPDKQVYTPSLPELETRARAAEVMLSKLQAPTISNTAENFLVSSATKDVINSVTGQIAAAREDFARASALFASMKSHLYRYAADTLISLEFGAVAEDLFLGARQITDEFIRDKAPKAAEQLLAANERMLEKTPEALSASLTSCRRVLCTVADAVFPPQDAPVKDASGKLRKVGPEAYLNRLLAFIQLRVSSGSTKSILEAQVEHLAARLDAVYSKSCKGVHDDVGLHEAQLVLIQTYLFLSEVARLAGDTQQVPAPQPSAAAKTTAESAAADSKLEAAHPDADDAEAV